jgi:hypothetical protein
MSYEENKAASLRERARMMSQQGGGEQVPTPREFRGSGAILGPTIPRDMELQLEAQRARADALRRR